MKKCSQCQKEILDNTKICPYCGTKQKKEDNSQHKPMRFCMGCGEQLKEEDTYCPKCRKPVDEKMISESVPKPVPEPIPEPVPESIPEPMPEPIPEPVPEPTSESIPESIPEPIPESGPKLDSKSTTQSSSASNDRKSENKGESISVRLPDGILKIYGIAFGIMYAYFALTYLPYLSYYAMQDKLWGAGMIVACVWSSFILFIIAFKCQKLYGMHLLYALFGGAILKAILHIINIQRLAQYQYWNNTSSSYLPVIGTLLVAFGCYFLMKKEEMLEENKKPFSEIVREIPEMLQMILNNSSHEIKPREKKVPKSPVNLNSEGEKILCVIKSNIFLIFCALYTINLAYEIFSSFAFFKLVTAIFSIFMCVAIWMIYWNGRNEILDATGFAIVSGITSIRLGVRIAIWVIILLIAISAGTGAASYVLVLIFAAFDIGYWCSLSKLFSVMKADAKGENTEVSAGMYPIFILGINTVTRCIVLAWSSFLQMTANRITGTMNQYGDASSSSVGQIFSMFGLDYGYGYSQSSDIIQSFLNPITEWIQNTLGFSQNPMIMVIAVAIPILEILLLIKVRSYMNIKTTNSTP